MDNWYSMGDLSQFGLGDINTSDYGGYDPRLDPGTSDYGGYDPRLDPGVPSQGNDYGGGGDLYGNNPTGFVQPGTIGGGGGAGNTGGKGTSLADLLKSVGGLGGLASILGPLLSGAYQMNQNRSATNQLQDASKQANDLVSGIFADSKGLYQPYVTAGQTALGNAQAGVFKPLGARRLGDMIAR